MPDPKTPDRTPEPSYGPDEEGDVAPAKDDSAAAWNSPTPDQPKPQ